MRAIAHAVCIAYIYGVTHATDTAHIRPVKRLNFTLDEETVRLLGDLAQRLFEGNKSLTIRSALQSLASHAGHDGWVINGYAPTELQKRACCHTCGVAYPKGEILFRPVFERGASPAALPELPTETWLDCCDCASRTIDVID